MKTKLTACILILAALASFHTGRAVDAGAAPRVVKIRAGVDNAMKFDVTTIVASPGESIKIVFTNASTLPKHVMGHNWILVTAGTDPVAFAAAAATEAENGYIPSKLKDKILAFVGLLGPNETGEVTFTAPHETGQYPFLCSFPAHCFIGMRGMLVVKKKQSRVKAGALPKWLARVAWLNTGQPHAWPRKKQGTVGYSS